MKAVALSMILVSGSLCLADAPVFQEKGGVVAIEAESTASSLGRWKERTDVADFSGTCHLEFTGNKPESGPPESPLRYKFQIHKGGKYVLTLRARKRLETKREDISNDCYVALKGDFEAGGSAPLRTLKKDTKMFGGDKDGWGWASQLDEGQKKYPAEYLLKEGEVYELTISGRSQNFNIDRILLVHESENLGRVRKDNPAESKSDGAGSSDGWRLRERTMRKLTNEDGVTIDAELLSKTEDMVAVKVRGKRFEIRIETLSDEDQVFIRKWKGE